MTTRSKEGGIWFAMVIEEAFIPKGRMEGKDNGDNEMQTLFTKSAGDK